MQNEFRPRRSGGAERMLLLEQNQSDLSPAQVRYTGLTPPGTRASKAIRQNVLTNLNNFKLIARSRTGDASFKCLTYQLSMVGYAPTMVITGDGESGFDSGEGA